MKLMNDVLLVAFAIAMALPFGMGKARICQEKRARLARFAIRREN